jgi:Tol biopolymer transport system component
VAQVAATPESDHSSRRSALLRLLYLAPVVILLALGGGFVERQTAQQRWLETAYAAADHAASAGDLVAARDGFGAIAGFRDASARADAIKAQLAPLEAGYSDGLQAIAQGDYAKAVSLLQPIAQQAPQLEDVVARLGDARRLLADELRRQVDAAQTVHDWPKAEQLLRQLVTLDPADPQSRSLLASVQREHGPIVLGKDRALWLVAPDGSDARELTDAVHVIWPVWSPDRSQIAFLAPHPDEPMGNVAIYPVGLDGAAPRRLADGVSAHTSPSWSPDGTHIAYTSFAGYDPVYEKGSIGVRMVDVKTGVETDLTGQNYPLAFNPSWSPDGKAIAFVVKQQGLGERPQHAPGDVVVMHPGEDGFENVTNGAVHDVWSVAWSPRGDTLLLYSLFGQTWYEPPSTSIRILDRVSGKIEQLASIDERPTMPVWSPDGDHFAYTADEKTVVISDAAGHRRTTTVDAPRSGELTWSPDGTALIVAPWDAGTASTLVETTGAKLTTSSVRFEFDANPPFISPPQWASTAAMPPEANPAVAQSEPANDLTS